ncbi:MAG: hypothetical protein EPN84_00690 [Legionella sp.]|nr:MAG: hypothetical protein EPN84_00690 [Legionella sp.]
MFSSQYSSLRSLIIFLCICLLLPISNAFSINKHSIQLGKTIERMKICGDQALVRVRKNDDLSRLLTIDLNKLNILNDRVIDKRPFNCDEASGQYYFTSLTQNNIQQIGLFVYKKPNAEKPLWQYVLDSNDNPYTDVLISEKLVLLQIRYMSYNVPVGSPNLIIFDKSDGKKLWEFTYDTYKNESPKLRVFNNMLYITSTTGFIQAYSLDSFTLAWEIKNKSDKSYKTPIFDKETNTLITRWEYYDQFYRYAEVVGINPENGQTTWIIPEYPSLYFPEINESSKLIYMQYNTAIHALNVYHFENEEPRIQYQWKKGNSELGSPDSILVFDHHIVVTFYSNTPDKYAYVFNDQGKKIDEFLFEDIKDVDLMHSNFSNHTIYATGNGEFGTLEF